MITISTMFSSAIPGLLGSIVGLGAPFAAASAIPSGTSLNFFNKFLFPWIDYASVLFTSIPSLIAI